MVTKTFTSFAEVGGEIDVLAAPNLFDFLCGHTAEVELNIFVETEAGRLETPVESVKTCTQIDNLHGWTGFLK